jgi:double-strand break repair protein MRE11
VAINKHLNTHGFLHLTGTFRIYQPGSSVATSLSEGESSRYPKHMGMLEIHLEKFRLTPIAYKQVRPFVYGDLAMADVEGLDPRSARLEEGVLEVLTARVKQLIREARALITEDMIDPGPGRSFLVRDPQKVIVRLRVDYTG